MLNDFIICYAISISFNTIRHTVVFPGNKIAESSSGGHYRNETACQYFPTDVGAVCDGQAFHMLFIDCNLLAKAIDMIRANSNNNIEKTELTERTNISQITGELSQHERMCRLAGNKPRQKNLSW
jgi:hypothetical protein